MRVALIAGKFPSVSETFVIRQALSIIHRGYDLKVISLDFGDEGVRHAGYVNSTIPESIDYIRGSRPSIYVLIFSIIILMAHCLISSRSRRVVGTIFHAVLNGSWSSVVDLLVCFRKFRSGNGFGDFDFIVAHFGPIGVRSHYLRLAGYLSGPMGTVFHGADMSEHQTIKRYIKGYRNLFLSDVLLLPISNFWRERLISWGAHEDKIKVLRMGVNLTDVSTSRLVKAVQKPLRVLSVARFTEKKGLKYALAGFLSSDIEAVYNIIGGGPQEPELRKLAEEASGGKTVRFLGKCTQEEVFEALDQTDVFLLPSVTAATGDMEGIPVALMEAMSRGVLVIATDHSGIPELVVDGETGFLVPERDADAIAGVLNRIVFGNDDLPRLRSNALQRLRSDFDGVKLDNQLEEIIFQAASGAYKHKASAAVH